MVQLITMSPISTKLQEILLTFLKDTKVNTEWLITITYIFTKFIKDPNNTQQVGIFWSYINSFSTINKRLQEFIQIYKNDYSLNYTIYNSNIFPSLGTFIRMYGISKLVITFGKKSNTNLRQTLIELLHIMASTGYQIQEIILKNFIIDTESKGSYKIPFHFRGITIETDNAPIILTGAQPNIS